MAKYRCTVCGYVEEGSLSADYKCPRCGNLFHVNGLIPMYFRRCLHCGLPLNADKKKE